MNGRERILLIALAAAVILMGGFKLLIEPELTNLGKVGLEFAAVQEQKLLAQNNLTRITTIASDNKTLEEKIKTNSSVFFPELTTDKVHIWFNTILSNVGINFSSFKISTAETAQITNPTIADNTITYPAKDAANGILAMKDGKPVPATTANSTKTAAATQEKQQPTDLVEAMPITMQYSGTYEQALALLDAIKNSGRTSRVTVLSTSTNDAGVLTYNVTIECFGLKKFTEGDDLSKDTLATASGKANPFQ